MLVLDVRAGPWRATPLSLAGLRLGYGGILPARGRPIALRAGAIRAHAAARGGGPLQDPPVPHAGSGEGSCGDGWVGSFSNWG